MDASRRRVLDCSDLASALKSLAALLGQPQHELRAALLRFEADWRQDVDKELHRALGFEVPEDLPIADATAWFHSTRALPGTDFSEGLLPTLAAFDRIWPLLGSIAEKWVSAQEWDDYRRSFETADRHYAQQFHQKSILSTWQGPFAFLVRDCAVGGRDAGHKSFMALGSEAVEDICDDFAEVFGHSLRQEYVAATRRCLVVFTAPGCDWRSVRAALLYAYFGLKDLGLSLHTNDNFVGNGGKPIPRDWIREIEWL